MPLSLHTIEAFHWLLQEIFLVGKRDYENMCINMSTVEVNVLESCSRFCIKKCGNGSEVHKVASEQTGWQFFLKLYDVPMQTLWSMAY